MPTTPWKDKSAPNHTNTTTLDVSHVMEADVVVADEDVEGGFVRHCKHLSEAGDIV